MRRSIPHPRFTSPSLVGAAMVMAALLAGCSDQQPAAQSPQKNGLSAPSKENGQTQLVSATPETKSDNPAINILHLMGKAYLEAKTYSDEGQAVLRGKVGDEQLNQQFPFAVAYERPNRLRLTAYEGQVISNGATVFSLYEGVPGYVVEAEAPPQLAPADVYRDDFIRIAMLEREAGGSLPLSLLLSDQFVDQLIAGAEAPPQLLSPQSIGDRMCDRIEFRTSEGNMVIWVDQSERLLRRAEYPVEGLRKYYEQHGPVSDLAVVADFHNAQINGPLNPTMFAYQLPEGHKAVKRFVGLAPPEQLGKKAPSFTFKTLDGEEVTPETLAGKIVVLDFWATWCKPCLESMPHLAKVQERFKDNDKVQFLAVNIEEETVTPEKIKTTLEELAPAIRVVRDLEQHAFKSFGIDAIPFAFIVGADGTVQDIQRGINPDVEPVEDLTNKINTLLEGKSLAQLLLEKFEQDMLEPPPATPVAPGGPGSEAKPAEKSEPQSHRLVKLWTAEDIHDPGNIYILPNDGKTPRILALEGWQTAVDLDASGKVISRYPLELPGEGVIAYLSYAMDGKGSRYYLGSAIGQAQVHLYDDQFKRLLSYPGMPDHPGIFDSLLADLNGDGQLELLISYLDVVGVQSVNLQGERIWSNRSLRDVFQMVLTDPVRGTSRDILAAHSQGTIARIDAQGERGEEIKIPDQFFRTIATAPLGPGGKLSYAGLGLTPEGNDVFIGFTLGGQERFSYALPRGDQHPSLEQVTWGPLVGDSPHWVVAGPEGSVHFVADDGQLLDRFNYGEIINGVAATSLHGKPVLLISSRNGLEAWQVEQK